MKLITIKIDRDLHDKIKKILGKNDFKYKYPSVASFASEAIFEKLESIKNNNLNQPRLAGRVQGMENATGVFHKLRIPKIKW